MCLAQQHGRAEPSGVSHLPAHGRPWFGLGAQHSSHCGQMPELQSRPLECSISVRVRATSCKSDKERVHRLLLTSERSEQPVLGPFCCQNASAPVPRRLALLRASRRHYGATDCMLQDAPRSRRSTGTHERSGAGLPVRGRVGDGAQSNWTLILPGWGMPGLAGDVKDPPPLTPTRSPVAVSSYRPQLTSSVSPTHEPHCAIAIVPLRPQMLPVNSAWPAVCQLRRGS